MENQRRSRKEADRRLGVCPTVHVKFLELPMRRPQINGKSISIHGGGARAGAPAEGIQMKAKSWPAPILSSIAGNQANQTSAATVRIADTTVRGSATCRYLSVSLDTDNGLQLRQRRPHGQYGRCLPGPQQRPVLHRDHELELREPLRRIGLCRRYLQYRARGRR